MAVVNNSFPYFNIPTRTSLPSLKDFTKPLHVDCSVEYELPNSAKPPVGTKNEPLLMIHPSYYRREESQNRSPFINNLPQRITNYMSTTGGSSRRSQMRAVSGYSQQSNVAGNSKSQINSCSKAANRPPLICSSNEAVNCNTDIGIFRRSPMTATNSDITLHSDIQAVSDARYLTVMKDNKSFIAGIYEKFFHVVILLPILIYTYMYKCASERRRKYESYEYCDLLFASTNSTMSNLKYLPTSVVSYWFSHRCDA